MASRGRYLDVDYAVGRHGDVVAQLVEKLWRNPQGGAAKLELVGPRGGGGEREEEGKKFILTGVGGAKPQGGGRSGRGGEGGGVSLSKRKRRWDQVRGGEGGVGRSKEGIEKVGVEGENIKVAEKNEREGLEKVGAAEWEEEE